MEDSAQRPVEIILARRLISNLGAPALLVDIGGAIVFFNDAAAAVLGVRFEEAGAMSAADWSARLTTCDGDGRPVAVEELPLMIALHEERPAYRRLRIRTACGDERQLDVSAVPILGNERVGGAMAIFWDAAAPQA